MWKKTITASAIGLLTVALSLAVPVSAGGAAHDFEGLDHLSEVGDHYEGYSYERTIVHCALPPAFPPSSGSCAAYDPDESRIGIQLDTGVIGTSFGAAFVKGSGVLDIELSLFGIVVETIDCEHATTYETTWCESESDLPFDRVDITGDPAASWAIDDVTFELLL